MCTFLINISNNNNNNNNPTVLPSTVNITMPLSSRYYEYYSTAAADISVSSLASFVAATVAFLLLLLIWKKRLRETYPSYDEIPATILAHMPSKKDLAELDQRVDVIVVGSGVGGLASANVLSRFGYKVAVFEQHYTVGGSTHTYRVKKTKEDLDFDFDVGVHYVGGQMDRWNSAIRWLFDWLSDGKLEWSKIDEVYDVAYNQQTGQRIDFVGDHKENRKTILVQFPSLDPRALDLYKRKCRRARLVAYLVFTLKVLPPVVLKVCWKIGLGWLYKRYCLGKTYDVMKSCGLSDDVIGALTYSYGDYGTPPSKSPFFIQAFMESHYNGGGFFPKGGSSSIAKTLVAAIQRRGGHVFAAAPIDKIVTSRKCYGEYKATGVIVKGVEVRARKAVISDAGFNRTFDTVNERPPLVDQVAGAHQLALVHQKESMSPFSPSFAFFYLFIGLEGTDHELGLRGQNIWHVANWDHGKNAQELFAAATMEEALDKPPPLVFLSNVSAKDPDFGTRCPGKSTVTMIVWTDARWFDAYKNTTHEDRGQSYRRAKDKMTHTMLEVLHFHFPLTRGRVVFSDLGTPLSANKYLGRVAGEIYNLDHNESRFRSLNAQLALHPQSTVRNLYLTGQDVMAVSVEGAILSGCFTASRVSNVVLLTAAIPVAFLCIPWAVS
mmetsp:Transcript_14328/g.28902  ORF Transcript_14328/g.28902 Transcript_14328/m.28902 type:complete len:663 (+) Transcript_14328:82-2070(+)